MPKPPGCRGCSTRTQRVIAADTVERLVAEQVAGTADRDQRDPDGFAAALRAETELSLARDPTRWTPKRAGDMPGRNGRARPQPGEGPRRVR